MALWELAQNMESLLTIVMCGGLAVVAIILVLGVIVAVLAMIFGKPEELSIGPGTIAKKGLSREKSKKD